MISQPNGDPLASKADAAFEEVSHDIIARARVAKTEVVIWRDGKVLKLSPDEAELELAAKSGIRNNEIAE